MTGHTPEYKLTYWDAKGCVEYVRLILAYTGVEFEDIRIPIGTLTPQRKQEMCIGQLPTLEFDGYVFTKSLSMARFLAKKYGIAGEEELESLRMEESVYLLDEYLKKWIPVFYVTDEEQKNELRQQVIACCNTPVMEYFDNLLQKNQKEGNHWLVGKKMSWADIIFANFTYNYKDCLMKTDLLKDYPKLQELRARVFDDPKIKAYNNKKHETDL